MPILPDVHARGDERGVGLEVGVRGVNAVLSIEDPDTRHPPFPAVLSLSIGLSPSRRAGHLSRFGEAIQSLDGLLVVAEIPSFLRDLAARLDAPTASCRVEFPLLVVRSAPESGARGQLKAEAAAWGRLAGGEVELWQSVAQSVQTVCPCSKEMASRGAHNQRCRVEVSTRSSAGVGYLGLLEAIERVGSAPIFPVLKRSDEKSITERAYDHPAFVEDVVRDLALALRGRRELTAFHIEAQSQESIHPHDAFAATDGP